MSWISLQKKYFINLGVVLVAVLIGLLAMELLTRVFVDESMWRFRDATDDWMIDKEIGWRQKSNLNVTTISNGKEIVFKTNQDGVQTSGRTTADLRVLLLGDSTVVGRAVPSSYRMQTQLARYSLVQYEVSLKGVRDSNMK